MYLHAHHARSVTKTHSVTHACNKLLIRKGHADIVTRRPLHSIAITQCRRRALYIPTQIQIQIQNILVTQVKPATSTHSVTGTPYNTRTRAFTHTCTHIICTRAYTQRYLRKFTCTDTHRKFVIHEHTNGSHTHTHRRCSTVDTLTVLFTVLRMHHTHTTPFLAPPTRHACVHGQKNIVTVCHTQRSRAHARVFAHAYTHVF
jgi:hypothetical protein